MNCITTDGESIFNCVVLGRGARITISVLSWRACLFAMWKSRQGKWKNQICELNPQIGLGGLFLIHGFQPDTGYFIATKAIEKVKDD